MEGGAVAGGRKWRVACTPLGSTPLASAETKRRRRVSNHAHFLPHNGRIKPTAVAQHGALNG